MIWRFDDGKISEKNGNKANSLIAMRKAGFNVPDGFVLDSDSFEIFLKENKLQDKVIKEVSAKDSKGLSKETLAAMTKGEFDATTLDAIKKLTSAKKKYAVRSSCTKEDLGDLSFAGQYETFLNVSQEDIPAKIIECYKATFDEKIIAYCAKNGISLKSLKMAVVVQEMVDPDFSGICFTTDPSQGYDKKMLIEVAPGIGENLVSGHKAPEQYHYNWFEDQAEMPKKHKLLTEEQVHKFGKVFSDIQLHFGFPCDIEFAVKNKKLFILQSRKITKFVYGSFKDTWSTADFKDGGVSATVCTPFMWSLYEYIWEATLAKFILDSKILDDSHFKNRKLGEMYFGRCYWNLSVVKEAMSQVVGYREREFDNEYGIKGNYEGDGRVTKFSPKVMAHLLRMALAQKKIVKEREQNAEKLKAELLDKYNKYCDELPENRKKIEEVWLQLVKSDYFFSESTYFWQIFINTIHQSLYKDSLLKHLSEDEYLTVLGGIKDISHLRPFYAMWDISREIRKSSKEKKYWQKSEPKQILKDLKGRKDKIAKDVAKMIEDYGYHSDKELDVTFECYFENPLPYIENIKNMVSLEDKYGPEQDQKRNHKKYLEIMDRIHKEIGDRKFKKVEAKIKKMRKMLWWREEFRDTSTRFYYLVHIYSLELGKELAHQKVLKEADDVWMLKIGDLWKYYNQEYTEADLRKTVDRRRHYYNCFRNYMSDNEIVPGDSTSETATASDIHGLGACAGKVTATARVINDFSEIDRLKEGDILVTRFTDTGWTPKFAIISGIVTEYGGILCHAAIVSREYGIPAVVNCHDALKKIKDGQKITIDGSTGNVIIEDKK